MIFLLDECVDETIAQRLREDGHEVLAVCEMEPGIPDDAVLSLANTRGAVLITSDKDFGELVFRDGRVSHGVLLVRLAGLSPAMKAEIVSSAVRDLGPEMQRAFTVVSPGIVRVRRRI